MVNAPSADPLSRLLVPHRAGSVIFQEGQSGSEMFIIESGSVEIAHRYGPQEKRLALLEAGDFFGEMSVLEDLPRSATARAVSDCRLLPIDASTFDQMLRDYPEVAVRMLRKLSHRLRQHEEAQQRAGELAREVLAGMQRSDLGQLAPVSTPTSAHPVAPPAAPAPTPPVAPPPVAAAPRQPVATLVHAASGKTFSLGAKAESLVGRFDPVTEQSPEIDLTDLDQQRSLSRRHARLMRRDGRFFVREEIGTANGTFVGGERLATGKEREIRDGDQLRFGRVDLTFRVA